MDIALSVSGRLKRFRAYVSNLRYRKYCDTMTVL